MFLNFVMRISLPLQIRSMKILATKLFIESRRLEVFQILVNLTSKKKENIHIYEKKSCLTCLNIFKSIYIFNPTKSYLKNLKKYTSLVQKSFIFVGNMFF